MPPNSTRRTFLKQTTALALGLSVPSSATPFKKKATMKLNPIVEAEEDIYTFEPADNGAGPLWCHGSTIVARRNEDTYVAVLETLPDQAPLHNCRWLLYQRRADGWRLVHRDTGRTREPSPIALLGNGDLLVSANPTLAAPDQYSGPAEPTVFRFDTDHIDAAPVAEHPAWQGEPAFTEHSYRTVTTDAANSEVLYMQNEGMHICHLSLLQRDGRWTGLGKLAWPLEETQPLRLCYPNVALRDRAAHFLGVGDIVEPVEEWRQAKFELTGRKWDYVFRRLFYAHTPDICKEPFGEWLELANFDATAGRISSGDIWVDAAGTAHLIWLGTSADERLRDRFFPDQDIAHCLEYLTLRDGGVVQRRTLARIAENEDGLRPNLARFHVLEDGSLAVLATFSRNLSSSDLPAYVYRLAPVTAADADMEWTDVPFAQPISGTFLTNTVRGGSRPSSTIDLVGTSPRTSNSLAYARIQIERTDG